MKKASRLWGRFNLLNEAKLSENYMSSAIPKALFSVGVNAPAVDARLQSPSESNPGSPSSFEYLGNNVFGGYSDVTR